MNETDEVVKPEEREFKTYSEQFEILTTRNLTIMHKRKFKTILQRESYYNIVNGYKKYFLATLNPEKYIDNVTFEQIYSLYLFDQNLRNIFMPHLLFIENNIKTLIAYHFSALYGHNHNIYLNISNFNTDTPNNMSKAASLITKINHDINDQVRMLHNAIIHYMQKYNHIPLWVLTNILTFGRINTFYSRMRLVDQQLVSAHFNLSASDFNGFIYFISDFRNKCAHCERIYTTKNHGGFQKFIPNTAFHTVLKIPLNSTNNFIYGKTDVLALLISFKIFLPKRNFTKLLNEFNKEVLKLEKILPPEIMGNIKTEMGIKSINLNQLK